MITPAQCAQIAADIYTDAAQWDHRWEAEGVVCAHRKIGDEDVLVFRGSLTAEDWLDDFDAIPIYDREIGFAHVGFLEGMDEVLALVQATLTGPIMITGHSLGGARARIAAAKLLVRKRRVAGVVTFGSPKPGFANIGRVLQKSGVPHLSFRNRNDPVPLVPFALPLLPWEHPDAWTAIDSAPGAEDLDPLRDHSSALYVAALTPKTEPAAA